MDTPEPEQLTLKDKLNKLIQERWPGDAQLPGIQKMAAEISATTGLKISTGTLYSLRNGLNKAPKKKTLLPLARFFGVSMEYLDPYSTTGEPILPSDENELSETLRDKGVLAIAFRSAGLSDKSKNEILAMIERARKREQLDESEQTETN